MVNASKAAARKKAVKELLIGLGVAAAGGAISYISFSTTKPGQRYHVYTGMIALGALYAIHGLYRVVFPLGLKKVDETEHPATEEQVVDDEEDKIAE